MADRDLLPQEYWDRRREQLKQAEADLERAAALFTAAYRTRHQLDEEQHAAELQDPNWRAANGDDPNPAADYYAERAFEELIEHMRAYDFDARAMVIDRRIRHNLH